MNKAMLNRVNQLEKKAGRGSALKRYAAAIVDYISSKGMDLPNISTSTNSTRNASCN